MSDKRYGQTIFIAGIIGLVASGFAVWRLANGGTMEWREATIFIVFGLVCILFGLDRIWKWVEARR